MMQKIDAEHLDYPAKGVGYYLHIWTVGLEMYSDFIFSGYSFYSSISLRQSSQTMRPSSRLYMVSIGRYSPQISHGYISESRIRVTYQSRLRENLQRG